MEAERGFKYSLSVIIARKNRNKRGIKKIDGFTQLFFLDAALCDR